MTSRKDTTGVLIIHNDSSLLAETLESVAGLVDRLVVVDGAYEWVAPFCELNGEDPERSTDDLVDILEASNIPYSYHTGIWKNETDKRLASLEFVTTDRVMLIDSDEIYNVDRDRLDLFWRSGRVMASLLAPLFLHDDIVTWHSKSKSYPTKPVFLNLEGQDLRTVVASLWLLLPESEKGRVLAREQVERKPLGIFYHLSMFRTQGNPYRRSRFYNLLSMRVAKRIGLGINKAFESDQEFTDLLNAANRRALNTMFNCHRLAAAYPQKKENQELVKFTFDSLPHRKTVQRTYKKMLADQRSRTAEMLGKKIEAFRGRSSFMDFTGFVGDQHNGIHVTSDGGSNFRLTWHIDCGVRRFEVISSNGMFPQLTNYNDFKRLLLEVTMVESCGETASILVELR